MKREPLVSIITPTYNHERFIEQCIESVLAQTFLDWEMIIVDDASTDGTGKIIKKFRDPRITYIKHSYNYGKERLAELHNEALALCRGEFITILEGDDYWPNKRLSIQIKEFETPDIILCHGFAILDKDRHPTLWDFPKKLPKDIVENEMLGSALKFLISGGNFLIAQSVMVRKSILDKIGGFKQIPSLYLVDYPTWMEFALYGKFAFVPEVLGYWRKHSCSITAKYQQQLWQGIIDYVERFISEKKDELDKLPVNLENYVRYPGVYALSVLYKISLLKNNKKEARGYLYKIWKRKKACEWQKLLKICLSTPLVFVPFLLTVYKKYIKIKTKAFS